MARCRRTTGSRVTLNQIEYCVSGLQPEAVLVQACVPSENTKSSHSFTTPEGSIERQHSKDEFDGSRSSATLHTPSVNDDASPMAALAWTIVFPFTASIRTRMPVTLHSGSMEPSDASAAPESGAYTSLASMGVTTSSVPEAFASHATSCSTSR